MILEASMSPGTLSLALLIFPSKEQLKNVYLDCVKVFRAICNVSMKELPKEFEYLQKKFLIFFLVLMYIL